MKFQPLTNQFFRAQIQHRKRFEHVFRRLLKVPISLNYWDT